MRATGELRMPSASFEAVCHVRPLSDPLADPRRLCVRRVSPVGNSVASRSRVRVGRVVLTAAHQRYERDSVGVDNYKCCRRCVGELRAF